TDFWEDPDILPQRTVFVSQQMESVAMKWFMLVACVALLVRGGAARAQDYPESIRTPKDTPKAAYKLLELAGRARVNLAVHLWSPPKVAAGVPVILFVHGIGMHGDPHGAIQAGFTARGLPFVAPDLRGHGRSGGVRGELAEPHVLRADLGAVIGLCNQQYP